MTKSGSHDMIIIIQVKKIPALLIVVIDFSGFPAEAIKMEYGYYVSSVMTKVFLLELLSNSCQLI